MGKPRKRAAAGNSKSDSNKSKSSEAKDPNDSEKKKSNRNEKEKSKLQILKQFVTDFPLISATLSVGIPFGLYLLYYFILLQHPDKVPFLNMRPGITDLSERQLLIVGTMGGATTQVSHELQEKLGLEVGHEASDAAWHFTRDGTVSWFHGIRFFDQDVNVRELCTAELTKGMGYHPRMFSSNNTCSYRENWSICWYQECLLRILKEWNCVRRSKCETPFRYNVFQARNPLRTIESLVAKFCQGDSLEDGIIHPTFLNLAVNLFPQADFEGASCIEAATTYVVEYGSMMVNARAAGLLDAIYPVETTSPCEVAKLAGLLEANTTVYPPNHERLSKYCQHEEGQETFSKTKNRRNTGILDFGWSDLRGGVHNSTRPTGDKTLEKQVMKLFKDLGYDIKAESLGSGAEFTE